MLGMKIARIQFMEIEYILKSAAVILSQNWEFGLEYSIFMSWFLKMYLRWYTSNRHFSSIFSSLSSLFVLFYYIVYKNWKKKSLKGALIITNSLRGNNCTIFRAGITSYVVWERRRFHFDSRIFTSIFSFQPNFFVGSASKFTRFMHFSFRFCLYVFVGYYISIMVRIIELLVHICEGKFMKRV